jgi:predicted RNase H-like nuclease
MKSGLAATSSWWRQGGGGVVPAMTTTGEVDRSAPVDRVDVQDGAAAWPEMGCDAAGGRALRVRGAGVQ